MNKISNIFKGRFVLLAVIIIVASFIIIGNQTSILSFIENENYLLGESAYSRPASASGLKNTAQKYSQGANVETPVTIRYGGTFYNYMPFAINGSLTGQFPGVMLDSKGAAVRNSATLKELFKYPGLVLEFADDMSSFNSLSSRKAGEISRYCQITSGEESKLKEISVYGTVAGVMYDGARLAFDAGTFVSGGALRGISMLAVELGKTIASDAIIKYFVTADTQLVRQSANSAYNNVRQANEACAKARDAWRYIGSSSGKASPEYAYNATMELYRMLKYEALAISDLRQALERINKYPAVITKIGDSKFKQGMSDLATLISKLEKERDYWYQQNQNATTFLDIWTAEHISRVK